LKQDPSTFLIIVLIRLLDTIYSDVNAYEVGGLNRALDMDLIIKTYGPEYDKWRDEFTSEFERSGSYNEDTGIEIRPEDEKEGYRWAMKYFYCKLFLDRRDCH
jgi:hypothetical protein